MTGKRRLGPRHHRPNLHLPGPSLNHQKSLHPVRPRGLRGEQTKATQGVPIIRGRARKTEPLKKLTEYWDVYTNHTSKASATARQLAFAGVAVIWIFKQSADGKSWLPEQFVWPLVLLCVALLCDLLQYVAASIAFFAFTRYHERKWEKGEQEPELDMPAWMPWLSQPFFIIKIGLVLVAYTWLIVILMQGGFFGGPPPAGK